MEDVARAGGTDALIDDYRRMCGEGVAHADACHVLAAKHDLPFAVVHNMAQVREGRRPELAVAR